MVIKSFDLKNLEMYSTDVSQESILNVSKSYVESSESFEETEKENEKLFTHPWGCPEIKKLLCDNDNILDVKPPELDESFLNELEQKGFLTDRLIALGLSFLTKSPENGHYIFTKCVLKQTFLLNINRIQYYRHLQYIDLSFNGIEDLTPLGGVSYLMHLNVSHNNIKDVLKFTPPWYLTEVDLSYNYIKEIRDISEFWSIVRLDLSHNLIEKISGLQNLKYLQYLNLSYNFIQIIENLDGLKVQELNLEGNCITTCKSSNFDKLNLPNLRTILLGENKIKSLHFFKEIYALRTVDLKYNKISDLGEISNFKCWITEIDFRGNPCTKWPNYREILLFSIPSITVLDDLYVSHVEKVSAITLFSPSAELAAARSVTKLKLLKQLNFPKIDQNLIPYDEISPPLITLCGPSTVKKNALALNICDAVPEKFKYCQWHTTRDPTDIEEDSKVYIFLSQEEFNEKTKNGEFIAVQELLGHSYGFHIDQISTLASERKIGITQTDLHASLQMEAQYSNVKSILVITKDEEIHRNWIKEKFDVYTWLKNSIADLLSVRIGRPIEQEVYESRSCKLEFISEIINEILENLNLPNYSFFINSQKINENSTTDITESMTILSKQLKKRSEYEKEKKKAIKFQFANNDDEKESLFDIAYSNSDSESSWDLKIILDEKSNIIIDDLDDDEYKYLKKRLKNRFILLDFPRITSKYKYKDSFSSEETLDNSMEDIIKYESNVEELKNIFTEYQIKSRKIYLEHHANKPGFFSLVLFTDDYLNAYNALIDFLYDVYVNHQTRKPIYYPEIQHLLEVTIPSKAKHVLNEIKEINN